MTHSCPNCKHHLGVYKGGVWSDLYQTLIVRTIWLEIQRMIQIPSFNFPQPIHPRDKPLHFQEEDREFCTIMQALLVEDIPIIEDYRKVIKSKLQKSVLFGLDGSQLFNVSLTVVKWNLVQNRNKIMKIWLNLVALQWITDELYIYLFLMRLQEDQFMHTDKIWMSWSKIYIILFGGSENNWSKLGGVCI